MLCLLYIGNNLVQTDKKVLLNYYLQCMSGRGDVEGKHAKLLKNNTEISVYVQFYLKRVVRQSVVSKL